MIFKKRTDGNIDKWDDEGNHCGNFQHPDDGHPFSAEYTQWLSEGNTPEFSEKESLKQKKANLIFHRKQYRKQMLEEWWDDVDNMPQGIKSKLKKEKDEIKEIKNATEEELNNIN